MSKKGENIYRRKDGRWEGRFIKAHCQGTAVYGYCYGRTYRETREKLGQAKADLIAGKIACKKRLGSACDEWLRASKSRVKESTLVKYSTIVERHIKPELGNWPLAELDAGVIGEFSYGLTERKALAAKTVKDILGVLRSVMKFAGVAQVEFVYPKAVKHSARVLSSEEEERLLYYLNKDMDIYKFGVLLALLTGLRLGELCALRWEDVSFEDMTIRIRATMQRLKDISGEHKTKIMISEPKSDNSARLIPMTAYVARLCGQWAAKDPQAFVLTGQAERYVEPRIMQYHIERYARECGLAGVHFHTLRHTFATRCVEAGFEVKSLSEILGHSSPKITLERYVHSSMELKRRNMEKLPDYSGVFAPSEPPSAREETGCGATVLGNGSRRGELCEPKK